MVTKDLQTLNLKFDQVMFNSLIFTWERNFELTFDIFSVLVSQISVLESYSDICLFKISSFRSFVAMAKNPPFCFLIQFLEELLKFLLNFTVLK